MVQRLPATSEWSSEGIQECIWRWHNVMCACLRCYPFPATTWASVVLRQTWWKQSLFLGSLQLIFQKSFSVLFGLMNAPVEEGDTKTAGGLRWNKADLAASTGSLWSWWSLAQPANPGMPHLQIWQKCMPISLEAEEQLFDFSTVLWYPAKALV